MKKKNKSRWFFLSFIILILLILAVLTFIDKTKLIGLVAAPSSSGSGTGSGTATGTGCNADLDCYYTLYPGVLSCENYFCNKTKTVLGVKVWWGKGVCVRSTKPHWDICEIRGERTCIPKCDGEGEQQCGRPNYCTVLCCTNSKNPICQYTLQSQGDNSYPTEKFECKEGCKEGETPCTSNYNPIFPNLKLTACCQKGQRCALVTSLTDKTPICLPTCEQEKKITCTIEKGPDKGSTYCCERSESCWTSQTSNNYGCTVDHCPFGQDFCQGYGAYKDYNICCDNPYAGILNKNYCDLSNPMPRCKED